MTFETENRDVTDTRTDLKSVLLFSLLRPAQLSDRKITE